MYKSIQTIRYMGNKNKLLDFIIPEIENVARKGGIICDLMGGTNSIGYALKENYQIFSNDIQEYSQCIAKAIIENNNTNIDKNIAIKELTNDYEYNNKEMIYKFFYTTYSDTYFSKKQCINIDSIRYAIEKTNNNTKKYLYLTALMSSMCKVQSTPGHFAQFMQKENKRVIPLRNMNIWDVFLEKCEDLKDIVTNNFENKSYKLDYIDLLKNKEMKQVDTFYLDSPYSGEQYSRFYHILETIVKYDNPKVSFKAKYRENRFMSKFCYKKTVEEEFRNIISYCRKNGSNLVISYSNSGVIECQKLEKICREYYNEVEIKTFIYKHSTQGKGNKKLLEYLFILKKNGNLY